MLKTSFVAFVWHHLNVKWRHMIFISGGNITSHQFNKVVTDISAKSGFL